MKRTDSVVANRIRARLFLPLGNGSRHILQEGSPRPSNLISYGQKMLVHNHNHKLSSSTPSTLDYTSRQMPRPYRLMNSTLLRHTCASRKQTQIHQTRSHIKKKKEKHDDITTTSHILQNQVQYSPTYQQ